MGVEYFILLLHSCAIGTNVLKTSAVYVIIPSLRNMHQSAKNFSIDYMVLLFHACTVDDNALQNVQYMIHDSIPAQ